MRILHRYILREIAYNFVAVTGVLAVILVSFRIAKVLDMAASNQFPSDVVLSLIGLMSITELTVLMPVGLFLAVMLGLGRLYHDSEMAAVQTCGVGVRQLFRPVVTLSVAVAALLCWLSLSAVPSVVARVQEIRIEAVRQARLANIAPQHFGSFAGGDVVYYAERVDDAGMLYNVFVQRRVGDKVEVTVADRAEQMGAGEPEQTFVLYNGESYEGVPGSGAFRITKFAELGYPIKLPSPEGGAARVESKPTLDLALSAAPEDQAELHTRIASPLMAVILALLAVPLARLRPRQGRYSKMGLALLAYFIYQIGLFAAGTWIEKERLPSVAGFWWVHAAAFAFAMWLALLQDPLSKARKADKGRSLGPQPGRGAA
jgi:lipopolysaccharide export system permease protein